MRFPTLGKHSHTPKKQKFFFFFRRKMFEISKKSLEISKKIFEKESSKYQKESSKYRKRIFEISKRIFEISKKNLRNLEPNFSKAQRRRPNWNCRPSLETRVATRIRERQDRRVAGLGVKKRLTRIATGRRERERERERERKRERERGRERRWNEAFEKVSAASDV
jgi:hypothetical protein